MSRITGLAHLAINDARRAVTEARKKIREACDESEKWLSRYAKDTQCDDEDVLAIVAARAEIDRIRAKELS